MRSAAGAYSLAFRQLVANFKRLVAAIAHTIQYPAERFHAGAHSFWAGEELVLDKVSCDGKNSNGRSHSHPAKARVPHLRKFLLPRRQRAAFALPCFGLS